MDIVTYAIAKKYTDKQIAENNKNIPTGALKLSGQVASIAELPQNGNKDGDVYIVGEESAADKAEYYWFENQWNYLGETPVDLSDYVQNSDISTVMADYGINSRTQIQEMETEIDNQVGRKYYVDGVAKGEVFNRTDNVASGENSHAEGYQTKVIEGDDSHAEGQKTIVSHGYCSHAEGLRTTALGTACHVEGFSGVNICELHGGKIVPGVPGYVLYDWWKENKSTLAKGDGSHAEGFNCLALLSGAHAEGRETAAIEDYTHAEGHGTVAASIAQHVQGKYNVEDSTDKYAYIIGNGTSDTTRSNAFAIDWQGNIYVNNSETGVNVNDLMPKSSIVKLNSMDEFNALTEKTADWYFIKEG